MRTRAMIVFVASAACAGGGARVETGTLPVAGGELYFEVAGSGEPIVLIHGGFGDRRMWDDQFDARDYRVLRYDHRGFGRSPAPDTTYSPVRDLIHLLDRAEMDRAHIVGNSLGGALALTFGILHPERVRSLTVVASGADGFRYPQADIDAITEVVALMRGGEGGGGADEVAGQPDAGGGEHEAGGEGEGRAYGARECRDLDDARVAPAAAHSSCGPPPRQAPHAGADSDRRS